MEEWIEKNELLELLEIMTLTVKELNTNDVLELYGFYDASLASFNQLRKRLSVKVWKEYVKLNPEINENDYEKKLTRKLYDME